MAGELKKLCELLKAEDVELQRAAALVLGEIGPRDYRSIRCLGEVVSNGNRDTAVTALKALGKIKSKRALPYLVPCLNSGEERRVAATKAIATLGADCRKAIRKEFSALNVDGRIAAIDIVLEDENDFDADFILSLLVENDSPDVAAHICDRLKLVFEGLTQKARNSLRVRFRDFLAKKAVTKNTIAVVAGLRLLSYLHQAKALPIFVVHLDGDKAVAVRRHALNALNSMPLPRGANSDLVCALLPLVYDRDHPDLVTLALNILSKVKIPACLTDDMIKLLYSRQSAVRRLAVRALGHFNSKQAAEALLKCLGRSDWELQSETIAALRRINCTADLILKEIQHTEDREHARSLVSILRGAHLKPSQSVVDTLTERFFEMLSSHDEMSEIYYSLLSGLGVENLSEAILEKAREFKDAGKFKKAEHHLRLLSQAGPVRTEVKYEFGVVSLKLSKKKLKASERCADPALPLFAELLRESHFKLSEKLLNDDTLEPEDIFYVGYHFAEGSSIERSFAAGLLKHIARETDDDELKEQGRSKLNDEGLAASGKKKSKSTATKKKKKTRKKASARGKKKKKGKPKKKPAAKKATKKKKKKKSGKKKKARTKKSRKSRKKTKKKSGRKSGKKKSRRKKS